MQNAKKCGKIYLMGSVICPKEADMSVSTSNVYGKISITDSAIAKVAVNAALECYGIVDTVARRFTDSLSELFKKPAGGKA